MMEINQRTSNVAAPTLVSTLFVGVVPASAHSQDGSGGGALGDVIVQAAIDFLRKLFAPVTTVIENQGSALLKAIISTPHPNAVFVRPTNGAWPNVYDYYWQSIVPITLSLFGLAIGIIILLETTSHLFSSYHRSKLKKRAFTGLLGVLSWWWLAAISLRFADALTGFFAPSLSNVTLFETASFSSMGVLGVSISLATDSALFLLLGLVYQSRTVILFLFVLMMPILIVCWIPGVGPFTLLSRFVRKLAGFYVPFLFMTIPVALLLRLGDLLGHSVDLSMGGLGRWLTAIVIPVLALLSPIVMIWQAGGIFVMGEKVARHVHSQRARRRIATAHAGARQTAHGGRNFLRGTRGAPAIRSSGQTVLGSGDSRAHATGDRLNTAGGTLRSAIRSDGSGATDRGGDREAGDAGDARPGSAATDGRETTGHHRGFDHLRDRPTSSTDSYDTDDDD